MLINTEIQQVNKHNRRPLTYDIGGIHCLFLARVIDLSSFKICRRVDPFGYLGINVLGLKTFFSNYLSGAAWPTSSVVLDP